MRCNLRRRWSNRWSKRSEEITQINARDSHSRTCKPMQLLLGTDGKGPGKIWTGLHFSVAASFAVKKRNHTLGRLASGNKLWFLLLQTSYFSQNYILSPTGQKLCVVEIRASLSSVSRTPEG